MTVEEHEAQFGTPAPDTEPGMNLISVDFDLVMVNRTNERLYGKSMVALLGNKCYREFEKRDEPCPHCPGRLALETGEAQEAETTGLRDDGTRFAARIKAHPVIGPDNRPTGFIEIVEDITEQKRAESLALIDANLQASLAGSPEREERSARSSAGGPAGGGHRLRGRVRPARRRRAGPSWCWSAASPRPARSLRPARRRRGFRRRPEQASPVRPALLGRSPSSPYSTGASTMADLVVGSTVYPEMPPSLRNGLQVLGATTGTAISRILAEQSRGDAIADLEAVIAASPLATWAIDGRGRITMWNKAAEKVFGWRAAEVAGSAPPWGPAPDAAASAARGRRCSTGRTAVRWRCACRRLLSATWWATTRPSSSSPKTCARRGGYSNWRAGWPNWRPVWPPETAAAALRRTRRRQRCEGVRVLIVDGNEPWGEELAGMLSSLGCTPVRCVAPEQTAAVLAEAGTSEQPFCVAVVALLGPGGASGLGQRAALRSLGLQAPVIMSSDVDVRGHEQHGIAAVDQAPLQRAKRCAKR